MTDTDVEVELRDRLHRLAAHARTEPTREGATTRRPPRRRAPVAVAALVVAFAAIAAVLLLDGEGEEGSRVATEGSTALPAPDTVAWPGVGDTWTALPAGPADDGLFNVTVWTGAELLTWGGETVSETEWADDGAAYDPTTGSWRPLAGSPLTARSEHVAVWTGAEMITCCGRAPEGPAATAAAYDPEADDWRELAPPPFEAQYAAAVWTGSEMIVTGGITDGGQGQAEGTWAYDPVADTWTGLAPAPAVIERQADAAWTGDRMIVWPRTFTDAPPMVYDREADEWAVLPDLPEELAVDIGSMVWTGTEVIVWGVAAARDSDAVGARLSLDDLQWRPLADDPLPPFDWWEGTPGSNSAVWTGEEIVVWTGAIGPDGVESETTVLAYDPDADQWRELDKAPAGSFHPELLWTGVVVVVLTNPLLALDP